MSIYFFGPEPGRVLSVHDANENNCSVRDRNRELIPHKHVVLRFGEDPANDIVGSVHTVCDFQLCADGGWQEIQDAIAAAPVTSDTAPPPAPRAKRTRRDK